MGRSDWIVARLVMSKFARDCEWYLCTSGDIISEVTYSSTPPRATIFPIRCSVSESNANCLDYGSLGVPSFVAQALHPSRKGDGNSSLKPGMRSRRNGGSISRPGQRLQNALPTRCRPRTFKPAKVRSRQGSGAKTDRRLPSSFGLDRREVNLFATPD